MQLHAQLYQLERLEIPLGKNEDSFSVLSANQEGIVLFRSLHVTSSDLQIIHIDTSFQQKWSGTIPVDRKYVLGKETGNQTRSYFLFHHRDFTDITFHLYEVDLKQGSYQKYFVRNLIPFKPTFFEVTDAGALIGGYFAGRIPVVLFYEFSTFKSKILPGLFNEPGELIQIKCNENSTFTVLISAKNFSKQKTLWIKHYSPAGDLIQNAVLTPLENSSLLFGRIITLATGNQIISGVYGNRNSDYSRGLFLARLDTDKNQELRYYSFADLENFFQYLKAKREKRIKERIKRKKIKGRKIRYQYHFLVHELIEYNNEYVLLGEAFYPRYRNVDRNFAYGVNAYNSTVIFDGYQYTHAIIIGFDKAGKLIWDNSFEINDIRSFTLEQFVKMDVRHDKIALLYLYNNKIRSKIIQDNTVLEGKVYSQLKMKDQENIPTEEAGFNKLDYWYDDTFLAHGVQQVTNKRLNRQNRRIFFVNKLTYQ